MSDGTGDKIKGKIKETTGVVTNDRSLETEGKLDQVKGKVKDVFDRDDEKRDDVRDDKVA
jgi:uncharacterized protein YjbJ (UPF0337 family)